MLAIAPSIAEGELKAAAAEVDTDMNPPVFPVNIYYYQYYDYYYCSFLASFSTPCLRHNMMIILSIIPKRAYWL